MNAMKKIVMGVFCLAVAGVAGASVLTVKSDGSGDYADIAKAVAAANDAIAGGEPVVRIEVGSGTYQLKAVLQVTKAIELVGLNGAAETIIDGVNAYRVEINHAGAVVDGFTIRRGG